VRPEQLKVFARNGKPGLNQIPATLLRAVERPHGVRLEFSAGAASGPVRVAVSRADYENQRDNREWVIQFPADALRVL
jgi:creatinine amidohydrolase/Fe(II)-dependent formamide hydrolase-like protein